MLEAKKRGAMPGERRGGRKKGTPNKATAGLKAAFQLHEKELVAEVMALTKDKDPRVRLGACQAAFDRGWGRPAQAITGGDGPITIVVDTGIRRT